MCELTGFVGRRYDPSRWLITEPCARSPQRSAGRAERAPRWPGDLSDLPDQDRVAGQSAATVLLAHLPADRPRPLARRALPDCPEVSRRCFVRRPAPSSVPRAAGSPTPTRRRAWCAAGAIPACGASRGRCALFRRRSFVDIVTVACIVLYVATLVFDPRGALRPSGLFNVFSPSIEALFALGATGSVPWHLGRWWTLITAIYLHGGVLHILFNVLWIRQLGPAIEQLYGPSRLVVIFTVAGVSGFMASNLLGLPLTIGASGSIFGLLGAMVAFGQKRGGTVGAMILRQYGQWALLLFVLGFLMQGVNNIAHAGGFVGGFAAGLVLALAERRAETAFDRLWPRPASS